MIYSTSNFSGNNIFVSNNASQVGGAIYISSATLSLCHGTISSTTEMDTVSIKRINYFEENSAGMSGGGIYAHNAAKVLLCGHSTFKNNSGQYGGAIEIENATAAFCGDFESYFEDDTYTIETVTKFEGNTAELGGAILVFNNATVDFCGRSMFKGNEAELGGAISVYNSLLTSVGHMEYRNNTATTRGGAVYVKNGMANYSGNNTFIENYAEEFGGAVYTENAIAIFCSMLTTNYFEQNSAGTNGGAIVTFSGAKLYLCGQSTFKSNIADVYGGAIHIHNASAVICGNCEPFLHYCNNSKNHFMQFEDNRANNSGGAIVAISNATLNICGNNSFKRNEANYGGAIYVDNSTLNSTAANMEHRNNYAAHRGGAIYVINAIANFSGNNSFIENHADQYGGAVYVENSPATFCMITDSESVNSSDYSGWNYFERNSAGINGGAVLSFGKARVNICSRSMFKNNTASIYGGAVHIESATAMFCGDHDQLEGIASNKTLDPLHQFEENRAYDGGAILILRNSIANFCGHNSFNGNTADHYGGAIFVQQNSTLSSTGFMEYTNNNATTIGGAIYVYLATTNFSGNNTFIRNHAGQYGGAVYVENATASFCTITDFRLNYFQENSAGLNGGALDTFNSAKVYFCHNITVFKNNQAGVAGGAFFSENAAVEFCYKYNDSVMDSYVPLNVFESNKAGDSGGAVSTYSNSIANFCGGNVFRNNVSPFGAAIIISSYTTSNFECYEDCTFVDNMATQSGGAMYIDTASQVNIRAHGESDIVFRNNYAANYHGGAIYSSDSRIIYYNIHSPSSNKSNFLFDRNTAHFGGAIAMAGTTKLVLNPQSEIGFTENRAQSFGGAIFFVDPVDAGTECPTMTMVTEDRPECFISLNITLNDSQILLNFTNNIAAKRGNVLYGGRLNRCRLLFQGNVGCSVSVHDQNNQCNDSALEIFKSISSVTQESNSTAFSSKPSMLCICNESSLIGHCQCRQPRQIGVSPGQTFTLALQTFDQYDNIVSGKVMSTQNNTDDYRIRHDIITTNLSPKDFNFSVLIGNKDLVNNTNSNITFALFLEGPCRNSTRMNISVEPCPFGFEFSPEIRKCHCTSKLQRFTEDCNVNDITIGRSSNNFWLSFTANHIFLLDRGCPLDYCKDTEVYIPLNDSDVQCNDGRTGNFVENAKKTIAWY